MNSKGLGYQPQNERWQDEAMRILRLLIPAGLLALSAPALIMAPASGHTSIVSMSPDANEVLSTAPTQVTIETTEEVRDMGSAITVTSPSGQRVDDGSTEIQGTTALIGLTTLTEVGEYTVNYRLLAQDGHPIEDSYVFSLSEVSPTPTPSETPTQTPEPKPSDQSNQWITIAAVVAALAALALLIRRMRR